MLADILHKLSKQKAEEGGEHKFYPRPSLAGTERCTRQLVYWGSGFDKDNKMGGRMYETMDDSSIHEILTIDRLKESAFKLHSEQMGVTIENSFPTLKGEYYCKLCKAQIMSSSLHGHIDWVLTDIMGQDWLIEHKALNHFSFSRYADGEIPMDYLTQLAIYIRAIHFVNPEINRGILLVKNKNTSQYIEYQVEYNFAKDDLRILEMVSSIGDERKYPDKVFPNIVKVAIEKFNHVLKCIADKHLPKREYDLDDWRCQYCGWQGICFKDYQKEFGTMTKGLELSHDCVDACSLYNQTKGQISELKKVADQAQERVRQIMVEANCMEGYARSGNEVYVITREIGERRTIDKKLIPPEILKDAEKVTATETFRIKNKTEKQEAGDKPKTRKKKGE